MCRTKFFVPHISFCAAQNFLCRTKKKCRGTFFVLHKISSDQHTLSFGDASHLLDPVSLHVH